MGTLHGIFQVLPKIIHGGAFVKVKSRDEEAFQHLYQTFSASSLHNTWLQKPNPNFRMFGLNQEDRIIPNTVEGLYLFLQSGSKYGFDNDFREMLKSLAQYLEDTTFFVIWDYLIQVYKIQNGRLFYEQEEDNDYCLMAYFEKKYEDDKALLKEIYIEEAANLKRLYDYFSDKNEDPDLWFDEEEYATIQQWLLKALEIGESEQAQILLTWIRTKC